MTNHSAARRPLSLPRLLLRLEGVALLAAAVFAYFAQGRPLWAFLVFLLAPDLSAVGYVFGPRIGSAVYNLAHITLWPLVLGVLGWRLGWSWATAAALIWLAHIGMDRMLEYGLKYPDAFRHTHFDNI